MNRPDGRRGARLLRGLALVLVAAVLCGVVVSLVVVFGDVGRLAPGPCSWSFGGERGGGSGEVGELLESPNFEASAASVGDLRSGVVDERLVSALLEVTEEHKICVDAFKEGHYFLPGVTEGPFIPEGYGEAGVLFSKYTRSGSEVPRSVERGVSQGRIIIGVKTRLFGYFSSLISFMQPGQILEGLK